MAQVKPILYSYFKSSCSWRARIALAYKGIQYECKPVDLLQGEQYSDKFLKLNPLGTVPVLVDDGKVIANSNAILEYLEETRPNRPLLPAEPVARGQVRALVDSIVAGIQPLQNIKILIYLGENGSSFGQHWVESGLSFTEKFLQLTHGKYCVGDNVTFADLCLVPQVYNATTRFGVDLSKFPLVSEISNRLQDLEEFQTTHPDKQPEFVEGLEIITPK